MRKPLDSCGGSNKKWWSALAIALVCSLAYLVLLVLSSNACDRHHRHRHVVLDRPNAAFSLSVGVTDHLRGTNSGSASGSGSDSSSLSISSSTSGTSLGRIVFGIAATARLWERRKHYLRLWWRPNEMRGFVWLDEPIKSTSSSSSSDSNSSSWSAGLPPFMISSSTSAFKYTRKGGRKAAIRISRIVSETYRVGLQDVDWFVMGDDDTMFVADNLVKVLSKYDHRRFYYIGASSESHHQNIMFSYAMAYGGGGFAISYALASALEARHDECLQRYPFLYGSDDRIHACMTELGVPLTREIGFHQLDVYGDVSGLLSAHPIAPLISMHHLDTINPIFPAMNNQVAALRHLSKAIQIDPWGAMQQSICYHRRRKWSISVSYGYLVKVIRGLKAPRDLETPTRTFMSWNRKYDEDGYSFTSRPAPKNPCDMPVMFYMSNVGFHSESATSPSVSNYTRSSNTNSRKCNSKFSPEELDWIYVLKERADESWFLAPRRQCCQITNTGSHSLRLLVRDCKEGEIIR